MFVIIGIRTRASKISEGCDRHYFLQRLRRWFTLFFLPIFPLSGDKGQQVKCQTCKIAFRPEVLQTPTSSSLADSIRDTMRVAAVAILKAGSWWDVAAREAAVGAIASGGVAGYDDDQLSTDLYSQDPSRLAGLVGQLARGLNDQGKERFIAHLAGIAAADGAVSDGEQAVLSSVASGLGMSAAHVLGIVTSVVNSPRT